MPKLIRQCNATNANLIYIHVATISANSLPKHVNNIVTSNYCLVWPIEPSRRTESLTVVFARQTGGWWDCMTSRRRSAYRFQGSVELSVASACWDSTRSATHSGQTRAGRRTVCSRAACPPPAWWIGIVSVIHGIACRCTRLPMVILCEATM